MGITEANLNQLLQPARAATSAFTGLEVGMFAAQHVLVDMNEALSDNTKRLETASSTMRMHVRGVLDSIRKHVSLRAAHDATARAQRLLNKAYDKGHGLLEKYKDMMNNARKAGDKMKEGLSDIRDNMGSLTAALASVAGIGVAAHFENENAKTARAMGGFEKPMQMALSLMRRYGRSQEDAIETINLLHKTFPRNIELQKQYAREIGVIKRGLDTTVASAVDFVGAMDKVGFSHKQVGGLSSAIVKISDNAKITRESLMELATENENLLLRFNKDAREGAQLDLLSVYGAASTFRIDPAELKTLFDSITNFGTDISKNVSARLHNSLGASLEETLNQKGGMVKILDVLIKDMRKIGSVQFYDSLFSGQQGFENTEVFTSIKEHGPEFRKELKLLQETALEGFLTGWGTLEERAKVKSFLEDLKTLTMQLSTILIDLGTPIVDLLHQGVKIIRAVLTPFLVAWDDFNEAYPKSAYGLKSIVGGFVTLVIVTKSFFAVWKAWPLISKGINILRGDYMRLVALDKTFGGFVASGVRGLKSIGLSLWTNTKALAANTTAWTVNAARGAGAFAGRAVMMALGGMGSITMAVLANTKALAANTTAWTVNAARGVGAFAGRAVMMALGGMGSITMAVLANTKALAANTTAWTVNAARGVGAFAGRAVMMALGGMGSITMAVLANTKAVLANSIVWLANPVGLVIGAIALAVGAAYLIWKDWDNITRDWFDFWNKAGEKWKDPDAFQFGKWWQEFSNEVSASWDDFWGKAGEQWMEYGKAIVNAWDWVIGKIKGALDFAGKILNPFSWFGSADTTITSPQGATGGSRSVSDSSSGIPSHAGLTGRQAAVVTDSGIFEAHKGESIVSKDVSGAWMARGSTDKRESATEERERRQEHGAWMTMGRVATEQRRGGGFFRNMERSYSRANEPMGRSFTTGFSNLKKKFGIGIMDITSGLSGIGDVFSGGLSNLITGPDSIVGRLTDLKTSFASGLTNLGESFTGFPSFDGIVKSLTNIPNIFSKALSSFTGFPSFDGIVKSLTDIPNIFSDGLKGFTDGLSNLGDIFSGGLKDLKDSLVSFFGNMSSLFTKGWDWVTGGGLAKAAMAIGPIAGAVVVATLAWRGLTKKYQDTTNNKELWEAWRDNNQKVQEAYFQKHGKPMTFATTSDPDTSRSHDKGGPGGEEVHLDGYSRGGIVPGHSGMPRLAIVHGGEGIINTRNMQRMKDRGPMVPDDAFSFSAPMQPAAMEPSPAPSIMPERSAGAAPPAGGMPKETVELLRMTVDELRKMNRKDPILPMISGGEF